MAVLAPSRSSTAGGASGSYPILLPSLSLVWATLLAINLLQDILSSTPESRIWLFDIDVERSLYTWCSQLLLAGVATLLLDTGAKMLRSAWFMGSQWLVLAGVFGLLSADEALGLHELASQHLSAALPTSGFLMFAWVIPAGVVSLLGLAAATPFLLRLPSRVRALMILSAGLFLGGAIGMEMVGGQILSANGGEVSALAYRLSVALEEGLEGLGVLVFLHSHLLYRRDLAVRPLLQTLA